MHGLLVEPGDEPGPGRGDRGACWRPRGGAAGWARRPASGAGASSRRPDGAPLEALYERLVAGAGPPERFEQLTSPERHEPGVCRAREDCVVGLPLGSRSVRQPAKAEAQAKQKTASCREHAEVGTGERKACALVSRGLDLDRGAGVSTATLLEACDDVGAAVSLRARLAYAAGAANASNAVAPTTARSFLNRVIGPANSLSRFRPIDLEAS